ncbi:hypothetical protein E2C01_056133 [Portunus trituberculatus]|uniref:Uncharacterized protein n=1 Tax=Portunus trituberculatus TaxID=210409 RepID=A0A5B7GWJ6_PORTR|nr:hypothetical protein [Portunus trituberculatus]
MISGRILAGRGLHYASPARNGNTIIISDRFGKYSTAAAAGRSTGQEGRLWPGAGDGGPRQGRHECHLKIVKVFLENHTICAVPQGRLAMPVLVGGGGGSDGGGGWCYTAIGSSCRQRVTSPIPSFTTITTNATTNAISPPANRTHNSTIGLNGSVCLFVCLSVCLEASHLHLSFR